MKLITYLYSTVTSYVSTLNRDTKGASAIEYAVIAGLIAVGVILASTALQTNLVGLFNSMTTSISNMYTP